MPTKTYARVTLVVESRTWTSSSERGNNKSYLLISTFVSSNQQAEGALSQNMPQTHQISMILPTFQQIMWGGGSLWDDHLRDLGYPSTSYRVRDFGFIDVSSIY